MRPVWHAVIETRAARKSSHGQALKNSGLSREEIVDRMNELARIEGIKPHSLTISYLIWQYHIIYQNLWKSEIRFWLGQSQFLLKLNLSLERIGCGNGGDIENAAWER